MAEPAQNQIEAGLFDSLQTSDEIQDSTPTMDPISAFIKKHIHPPSSIAGYCGMPTNDTRSQVIPQWKFLTTQAPVLQPAAEGALPVDDTTALGGIAILSTSGARVNGIVFSSTQQTGGDYIQDIGNTQLNDAYDMTRFCRDANLYRPAFKSLTTYLNATMFNNVGTVSGCQFNPNVLFAGTILTMAQEKPSLFIRFAKCLVASKHWKINKLGDDCAYLKIPKYVREELAEVLGLKMSEAIELDPNVSIQVVSFNGQVSTVPTQSQILNMSQRSYGGKAVDGSFTVHRLNTIAPSWLTTSNTDVTAGTSRDGLYLCYRFFIRADGSESFGPFYEKLGGVTRILRDTLWSKDMTWSWVKYAGLSPNLNTTTGFGTNNLMIYKYYTGFEVQPSAQSAWAGLQQLGPKPDMQAMQGLMDAFYELKDVMPARYNFWGMLGKLATKGLKTFGSSVLKDVLNPHIRSVAKGGKGFSSNNKENRRILDLEKQLHSANKKLDKLQVTEKKVLKEEHEPRGRSRSRPRSSSRGRAQSQPANTQPKKKRRKKKKVQIAE